MAAGLMGMLVGVMTFTRMVVMGDWVIPVWVCMVTGDVLGHCQRQPKQGYNRPTKRDPMEVFRVHPSSFQHGVSWNMGKFIRF